MKLSMYITADMQRWIELYEHWLLLEDILGFSNDIQHLFVFEVHVQRLCLADLQESTQDVLQVDFDQTVRVHSYAPVTDGPSKKDFDLAVASSANSHRLQ